MIKLTPSSVFEEYKKSINFKNSIGKHGIFEQAVINERFYVGDQWHGANCGNRRPLVRHNIIKRIGEFKMAQILASPFSVKYGINGVPRLSSASKVPLKNRALNIKESKNIGNDELNNLEDVLDKYYLVTSKRLHLNSVFATALKDAYIFGTGIVYTYWDGRIQTGTVKNSVPITGDIKTEVLDVRNVSFGNPYEKDIEKQPFIIIASVKSTDDIAKMCLERGGDEFALNRICSLGEKATLLTLLYKATDADGKETVMCAKFTENETVCPPYNTRLRRFPLAVFRWDDLKSTVYGESEITHIIPNQIAINRMITANVWAAITMGMPLMLVNGDTIEGDITNDPGQIIKVFGTNEDVAGSVKYVTPPDITSNFGNSVNTLIETTLTQCGANEVALGDSKADNMGALSIMRSAATMPLNLIKENFKRFVEEVALIWADFWITQYGLRKIKINDDSGIWYMPFNGDRYKGLTISCSAEVVPAPEFTAKESISLLTALLEKNIITKKEFFERLPSGLIPDCETIDVSPIEKKGETNDGI